MSIHLYNTATRTKDTFQPIVKGKVSLYTCGPTVYNAPHIGNWIPYIRWDTLVRMLSLSGYEVDRVMNITDVGHLTSDADEGEDKMEKGARREGTTAWEVARRYTDEFMQGMEALNLLTPEHTTKATEHIGIQLDLVRTLKEKGYTYQITDGIYFDTSKFSAYGDFARLNLESLKAGARVEVNREKRNPGDFALWKFTPAGQKRDMEWETPEGVLEPESEVTTPKVGFPGWHLECSAMAMHYLGETIDIHTGGIDHIPVHHTNEIAQSVAATGKPFAHYWLHNAHLLSDGTKISKSLGNGYTLEQIAERSFSPMDFRMFVLQSHYRTESNFTWENLAAAQVRLQRWRNVASLRWQAKDAAGDEQAGKLLARLSSAAEIVLERLQDDMDSPGVLKLIDEMFTQLESGTFFKSCAKDLQGVIACIDEALGLQLLPFTPDIDDEAKAIIKEREQARSDKNWQQADELRARLTGMGLGVRDTPHGSVWFRL